MMKKIIQAGAIPFRPGENGIEYLLITSMGGNWIFPKGIVDPGETPPITAKKESGEEAGIEGEIVGEMIGSYEDHKWGGECEVRMFLLRYQRDLPAWDEGDMRTRRWCSYAEADRLLRRGKLKKMLAKANEFLTRPPAGSSGSAR
ncbi:MAG: NUDIX hydrolase [Planctomycetes bacterium]|nr:NUDIX hydrolase [Planctomycetota bacterium]